MLLAQPQIPVPLQIRFPFPAWATRVERGRRRAGRRPVREVRAVRILHTADWHVGKTLHRRQRLDEVAEVLDEVVADRARASEVDLTLVCGDVFDQFAPSAEAERIVYRALVELRDDRRAVLVIPGNHDNARRFAAIEQLSGAAGIQIVPEVRRPDAGGIVEIASRDGVQIAQVAALPWVPEKRLFGAEEMMGLEERPEQGLRRRARAAARARCAPGLSPGKVHLLAGHLFVGGATVGGGERTLTIGDIFAVDAAGAADDAAVHRARARPPPAGASRAAASRPATPGRCCSSTSASASRTRASRSSTSSPGRPPKVTTVGLDRRAPAARRGRARSTSSRAMDGRPGRVAAGRRCAATGPRPASPTTCARSSRARSRCALDYEREAGRARAGRACSASNRASCSPATTSDRHGAAADERLLKLFDELFEEVDRCARLASRSRGSPRSATARRSTSSRSSCS